MWLSELSVRLTRVTSGSRQVSIAVVQGSRRWQRIFDGIERRNIPIFVAMQSAVVGGGFELAAAAHIRVAKETAHFGLPEGSRGIFVGGVWSDRIARLIHAQRTGDMMVTGRTVAPHQMEAWGGVSYIVPEGQGLEKAMELARKTAANSPMSNYAILNALPRNRDMSSEGGLFVESLMSSLTSVTPDAKERLHDFLELSGTREGKVVPPQ